MRIHIQGQVIAMKKRLLDQLNNKQLMNRMTVYQKISSSLFLLITNINYPQNVILTLQQCNSLTK
jgi:hypothetical protein